MTSSPFDFTLQEQHRRRHRTLVLLLAEAFRKHFANGQVRLAYSLGNGYYFHIDRERPLLWQEIENLRLDMRKAISNDIPLEPIRMTRSEVTSMLKRAGRQRTLDWLTHRKGHMPPIYNSGGVPMMFNGPLCDRSGDVGEWNIVNYPPGLLLMVPPADRDTLVPYHERATLFRAFYEAEQWGLVHGASYVSEVNRRITHGCIEELIQVAEALHDRKIAEIADRILNTQPRPRVVLVSGPSASGKTTFSRRLMIQLRLLGIIPHTLSLDNFYHPRSRVPRRPDGEFDFEALEALDIGRFNETLLLLIAGEEVRPPEIDFKSHRHRPGKPMKMENGAILIIEGIHGLNPRLTPLITQASTFKVHVSALTHLNFDRLVRVSTTDLRLIRRLVRDSWSRSYNAEETLARWPSVREGELKHIFPYQEEADVMFNSALPFELNVLKPLVMDALKEVRSSALRNEAKRLRNLLRSVTALPKEIANRHLPPTSILREFSGRSVLVDEIT